MKIEYPVKCPLMNNQKTDMGTCFDIHMVVCGEAPKWTAPKEIHEHADYVNICKHCPYHRED